MGIPFNTRPFYAEELRILRTLRTQKEKEGGSKIKFYYFIIAGLLGAGFTYIATLFPDSFGLFFSGYLLFFHLHLLFLCLMKYIKFSERGKNFYND
jgi:hypothetical protein